ncbi:hypothetical protein ODZ83_05385 [Acaricomes phytoseiuli]|uniref:hypothetical protein n=1 Tax=Acaricomes phytoseiuli TaxID=291968 RepID=UPI00036BFBDF|nr:hypothetical protein [Acaricomes phytoseiuli]MCW1249623.1 hypothetical protein [Acaricomes phytoseiuli]
MRGPHTSRAGAAGPAPAPQEQLGHTRLSSEALTTLVQAATAEAFIVKPAEVRVRLQDESGELAISIATPVAAPSLTEVLRDRGCIVASGGSVWQRTLAAKEYIRERVNELSGSQISRVDIRIIAVHPSAQRRVR